MHGLFDIDLHKVSWHFAIHKAEWVQSSTDRMSRSVLKNPFKMGFCFCPTLTKQIQRINPFKMTSKVSDCPQWSLWQLTALVCSFRSEQFDTAWLVKNMIYFDLIAYTGGCGRGFQCFYYNFSSHPKTLELTGKCGINGISLLEVLYP